MDGPSESVPVKLPDSSQEIPRLLFLLTAQESKEKAFQQFEAAVSMYQKLRTLDLKPVGEDVVRLFAQQAELKVPVTDELVHRLMQESEGNIFPFEGMP